VAKSTSKKAEKKGTSNVAKSKSAPALVAKAGSVAKKPAPVAETVVESKTPAVKSSKKAADSNGAKAAKKAEAPQIVIQPAAVPTDGKPRKNVAGLLTKELEFYRDLIHAKRREIVGDMSSMEREALRSSGGSNLSNLPLHMADMGTDNYEQEFTLGLMEKDRKLLRDLNDALAKIQNGTYGICEGTGKPISKARLEAQPWARYSIEWARKLERRIR
jgi:DnaK suppressor protein